MASSVITVSAVIFINDKDQILLVRKKNTTKFMLPGGKPEQGETPRDTAIREISEELSLELEPTQLEFRGDYDAPAANEEGFTVHAHLFQSSVIPTGIPAAEIEESFWLDIKDGVGPRSAHQLPVENLAPLTTDIVLPLLRS